VTASATWRSAWAPLWQRLFRAIWLASLASNVGTWMQNTAAAWMMTSLSPSPILVALMQTATSLPFFLLALPAGALADIVDRRRVLLITQLWMVVAAGALAALTLLGRTTAWSLLGLTFTLGVGAAFTAPAWQAFTPNLVGRAELPAAVALNGVSFNIARAIGPAAGGLLFAANGPGAVFVVNALSFLAVVAVLAIARPATAAASLPPERVIGAMRAGARFVRHSPAYRAVLIRSAAFMLPASALWALLPLVARHDLGLSATGYGLLLGCIGAGAIGGAALLPRLRAGATADRLLAASALLFAAATALLGIVRVVPVVAIAMVVAGVAWMAAMATLTVAAQSAAPAWVRARALAMSLLVVQGGLALGSLVWGAVADRLSSPTALLAGAAALVVAIAASWRYRLHGLADLDLTPNPHWPAPVILGEIDVERTPVLVTLEYEIEPAKAEAFATAMERLAAMRRRDGAISWGLYRDAQRPGHFLETFLVPSWLEHLRQHERSTEADRRIEDAVRAFLTQGRPTVTHFVEVRD
jgi:MFS family permease